MQAAISGPQEYSDGKKITERRPHKRTSKKHQQSKIGFLTFVPCFVLPTRCFTGLLGFGVAVRIEAGAVADHYSSSGSDTDHSNPGPAEACPASSLFRS
jgi:hypothetical protein